MSGSTAREIAVPHFVGRYEVLVPIASGGMATVYLARSRGAGGFEREVALKLTHAHLRESPEFQALLIEEAKLASAIRHNNIVSVLDVGDDPLGLFLVMDYVEGDTLSGLLRRARTVGEAMPRRLALRALLDSIAGLHAAHETRDPDGNLLHIVHRDFSPQNILVGVDGVAKLTDFGIAKAASRVGNTSAGLLKGKVGYMSPEHARGAPIDRRSDVWAAGVLAWEIIAGRPLWPRDEEDVAMLIKLVTTAPPRLREVAPDVSEALDAAVGTALAMDAGERWPTAAAFAKALAAAADVADAEELAAYVREVAGPKIAQRRQQVRSMGALRMQMGEIAEASAMTPSGRYLQPRALAAMQAAIKPPVEPEAEATEFVEAPSFSEPPPAAPASAPLDDASSSALRLAPPAATLSSPAPDVGSSSALRVAPAPPMASWWPPVVAGGVIGLCVLAIIVVTVSRYSSRSAPNAATTDESAQAPAQPPKAEPAPVETAAAPTAPLPTQEPPAPAPPSTQARVSPATSPAPVPAPAPAPQPAPTPTQARTPAPPPAGPTLATPRPTRPAVRPAASAQLAPSPY